MATEIPSLLLPAHLRSPPFLLPASSIGPGLFRLLRRASLVAPSPISPFRVTYRSPASIVPEGSQLHDADDEKYKDEDDDLAAEENDEDDISSDLYEASDDEAETSREAKVELGASSFIGESKVQRVEKLCNEVWGFGAQLIDMDDLASI